MALGGACDKGVCRTVGSLLISEPRVSHNCSMRKTSETSGKHMPYSEDVVTFGSDEIGPVSERGMNK